MHTYSRDRFTFRVVRRFEVLLPIEEAYLNLTDASRDSFPDNVTIAMAGSHVLQTCHDKFAWLKFCREVGIECPAFGSAETLNGLRDLLGEIGLPAVIRPVVLLVL